MIDGVKIEVPRAARELLRRSERIHWVQNGTFPNGRPKCWGTWMHWRFAGDTDHCWEIRGSLHKHAQGGTNWRDFDLKELRHSVEDLCDKLMLHPSQLKLSNVEVGVNVRPPEEGADILESLIHHKLKRPTRNDHGVTFEHDGYLVKVYDKAKQCGRPGSLLRYEVRAKNMREIRWLGIRTVADLLDAENWQGFEAYLLNKFDDILIAPLMGIPEHVTPKERELLRNATRVRFWEGLSRAQRTRARAKLYTLHQGLPGYDLRDRLREALQRKVGELTPRMKEEERQLIATFTPRVMRARLGRNPPSTATFAPLIARSASVAIAPWVWWRSRGPPECYRLTCRTGSRSKVQRSYVSSPCSSEWGDSTKLRIA